MSQEKGTIKDTRDGKIYKTVKIGNQTWMAENLNFKPDSDSWCYDNKPSNCDKYGRLYGWESSKKACPAGWHIPSKEEFETLFTKVGGKGTNAYNSLKSGGSSGFNALLGGSIGDVVIFYDLGVYGNFRTSTENKALNGFAWLVHLNTKNKKFILFNDHKTDGVSIRCLKDK
ncbi:MAG: fibrobacter succinogenes major paralogous domain-containing protein [Bacteroidia bacterium]|nr:fibrobacter succinogenes major paralogous domain-containing protein [Bacteroidia bacterium]